MGTAADCQADMAAAVQKNCFAILGANEIGKRHALGARDQIVLACHDIQNRASDVLKIDDVFADRHSILSEEVLLIKVFDELTIDFAGDWDVVVEPAFSSEKILKEFVILQVFVKIDRLFDKIADGPKQKERSLEKLRRAITAGIDKFVHIEIFGPAP